MLIERDNFNVEINTNNTGDIIIYVSVDVSYGSEAVETILPKEELKQMIDDLTKIYEGL
jgi:hypothetical protein